MSLEKISLSTSVRLRQASASLEGVKLPRSMEGLNRFVFSLIGAEILPEPTTLFVGYRGYVGVESYIQLSHRFLNLQVIIPEGQRAILKERDYPRLLSEDEGVCLMSDIYDSIDIAAKEGLA